MRKSTGFTKKHNWARDKNSRERERFRESPQDQGRDVWIYGLNPVLEALRSGRDVKSVFLSASRREKLEELAHEAANRGISIKKVDEDFFESRFPKGHQGIAAAVAPPKYLSLDELLALSAKKGGPALFLILDLVEDPRNFGAILRVADAGGVHGVVIQSHRSAALTPEAVKASAGAAEYMPIAMVPNIKHAIKVMQDSGITVAGTDAGAEKNAWNQDLSVPLAVVIGSEGRGLRRTVKGDCDTIISLPMRGRVNSLNASVAAGVVIFEIMRQRAAK